MVWWYRVRNVGRGSLRRLQLNDCSSGNIVGKCFIKDQWEIIENYFYSIKSGHLLVQPSATFWQVLGGGGFKMKCQRSLKPQNYSCSKLCPAGQGVTDRCCVKFSILVDEDQLLKGGYRNFFYSFISLFGYNIWWKNSRNGSFGPKNHPKMHIWPFSGHF